MNYPGDPSGNWTWRFREQALDMMLRARLREMNYLYYRQTER
jgi:4-alpha-glucanotransferase